MAEHTHPSSMEIPEKENSDYWHQLVDETDAARFLGVSRRHMQVLRQRGGGPRYIAISARCLRYRRVDLQEWAEGRLRTSTSDPGPANAQPHHNPLPVQR